MRCPTCPDAVLVMSERQGVEIDYCPQCRGVWLDRGELDKIIERASAELTPATPLAPPPPAAVSSATTDRRSEEDRYQERRDRERHENPYPKKKKKKSSFLEDLFEF